MRPGQSVILCRRRRRFAIFLECFAARLPRFPSNRADPSQRAHGRFNARTNLSVGERGATISDPNEPFSLRGGNNSSCPLADLQRGHRIEFKPDRRDVATLA